MDAPVTKKRSTAVYRAQKAYYERNREKRLVEMRERAKERNKLEKEAAVSYPEVLVNRRKRFLERYYVTMMRDTEKQIEEWLTLPGINNTFKTFLKECVKPSKTLLPRSFFVWLSKLSIAEKPSVDSINEIVDGIPELSTAELYANSQNKAEAW